jgi:DNA-binding IclR family transcriptional regulator
MKLSPDQIKKLLSTSEWENPPRLESYLKDIERAASDGWAIDQGNFLQGVTTIAVPIPDAAGKLQYCLSIALFGEHFETSYVAGIAKDMKQAAGKISKKLFHY